MGKLVLKTVFIFSLGALVAHSVFSMERGNFETADRYRIDRMTHETKTNTLLQSVGVLECKTECHIQVTQGATEMSYLVSNDREARRLYTDGVKKVLFQGMIDQGSKITVNRIRATDQHDL